MSGLFLTGGTIYTLDPARPQANAMAFVNGRVAARVQRTKPGEWILGGGWNHRDFGSDCPVETLDPLAGLHAAVTRERADGEPRGGWYPEERLSVSEALRAYADALVIGAPADCVILSQDIFSIPPKHLLDTRVEQTIFGGKIVYGG